MELIDAKNKLQLSRRSLLQYAGIFGTGAFATGCSKEDNGEYYGPTLLPDEITVPAEEEMKTITGGAARACGHLCVLKAHVKNGVIKRFTTDEILDNDISKAEPFGGLQSRACLKCRSWKYMMYSPNRLMYPMKQTGERGDLKTFRRVTWNEAMSEIKTKLDRIRDNYGPAALLQDQSGGTGGYAGSFLGLNTMVGGAIATRQDFSQACWEHVANFVRPQRFTDIGVTWAPGAPFHTFNGGRDIKTGWVKGTTGYNIIANAITDSFNAEHIVLWSGNPAEVFGSQHCNFYLKRCKEEGTKFTVIDQRYSPSAGIYADRYLSPVQNTDTAIVLAVIHSLLTDNKDVFMALYGASNDAELKQAIGKYVYGFFDEDTPTTYNSSSTIKSEIYPTDFPVTLNSDFAVKYKTPDGGSWSAYIFGDNNALVQRGLNKATSIYPDKIGYNVRDYDYPDESADPLKGKYVPCYGHVEKTPEWAEKITGVPASAIREFAKELVTKKTSIYIGFGLQRQHEGEQATWSILLLSTLILSFGAKGQSIGIPRAPGYIAQNDAFNLDAWLPPAHIHAGTVPALGSVYRFLTSAGGYMKKNEQQALEIDYDYLGFCDTKKISFPALTDTYTRSAIPIKEMYDAIGATNQPRVSTKVIKDNGGVWEEATEQVYPSLWNDGQVQRLPKPIKAIITIGSNKITSNGADVNRTVRNLTDKSKVELIVCIDAFMTGTARFADFLLPSAATFEKFIAPISTQGNEVVCIHGGKAVEPMGQSMNDIDMGWLYYKQWADDSNDNNTNTTSKMYKAYYRTCAPDDKMGSDEKVVKSLWENPNIQRPFSYDEWKTRGVQYAKEYANNYRTIPVNSSDFKPIDHHKDVYIWNQEFREHPEQYPLHTPSGRVEAYCQAMVEDYEARNFYNYDKNITLSTSLKFAGTPNNYDKYGRYMYPVPMYIPAVEGRHACDIDGNAPVTDCMNPMEQVKGYTKHPNPIGFRDGFDYAMCQYHPIQRVHTLHNSNPVINELFKFDSNGSPAYYNNKNTAPNPDYNAPKVMTENVYEPALLSIDAKYADGSPIFQGDIIVVESQRGKGLYSAKLTKRIKPFHISIAQGSAYNPDENDGNPTNVDKGGSTGTHISQRPSRFGRGFTASDIRVRITKA